jgi:hypothetical protein
VRCVACTSRTCVRSDVSAGGLRRINLSRLSMGRVETGQTHKHNTYTCILSTCRIWIRNTDTEYGAAPKIRIRIRNTDTEYGIRNTDTEYGYGIRSCAQTKYGIRIRNTDTEYGAAPELRPKLKIRMRIRNWEYGYGIRTCAQNTDADTEYGYGIRYTDLRPNSAPNTDADTAYRYGMRSCTQNTDVKYGIRIRNTDTECGAAPKIQMRIRNADMQFAEAHPQYGCLPLNTIQIKVQAKKSERTQYVCRIVTRSHHSWTSRLFRVSAMPSSCFKISQDDNRRALDA